MKRLKATVAGQLDTERDQTLDELKNIYTSRGYLLMCLEAGLLEQAVDHFDSEERKSSEDFQACLVAVINAAEQDEDVPRRKKRIVFNKNSRVEKIDIKGTPYDALLSQMISILKAEEDLLDRFVQPNNTSQDRNIEKDSYAKQWEKDREKILSFFDSCFSALAKIWRHRSEDKQGDFERFASQSLTKFRSLYKSRHKRGILDRFKEQSECDKSEETKMFEKYAGL